MCVCVTVVFCRFCYPFEKDQETERKHDTYKFCCVYRSGGGGEVKRVIVSCAGVFVCRCEVDFVGPSITCNMNQTKVQFIIRPGVNFFHSFCYDSFVCF